MRGRCSSRGSPSRCSGARALDHELATAMLVVELGYGMRVLQLVKPFATTGFAADHTIGGGVVPGEEGAAVRGIVDGAAQEPGGAAVHVTIVSPILAWRLLESRLKDCHRHKNIHKRRLLRCSLQVWHHLLLSQQLQLSSHGGISQA